MVSKESILILERRLKYQRFSPASIPSQMIIIGTIKLEITLALEQSNVDVVHSLPESDQATHAKDCAGGHLRHPWHMWIGGPSQWRQHAA